MSSLQHWVHWLEMGPGAALTRRLALGLGVLLFSLTIAYKQFHGPRTEHTLAQAVVGRQLASGHGFTTLVNYPQTYGFALTRGQRHDPAQPYPELHHPPLYSALIGAAFAALPDAYAARLWHTLPEPPDGFGPDYLLLIINILLLWLASWQTWRLARLLFDDWVGIVAALGVLGSAAIWTQTIAVNGTPLTIVVGLALLRCLYAILSADTTALQVGLSSTSVGIFCGLLFLSDYSALLALPFILGVVALRARVTGCLSLRLALIVLGFVLVVTPWLWRNQSISGHWLGLAGDQIALKRGDTQADPATLRASVAALAPRLDINKLGNKGLTALSGAFATDLWAGGAMIFAAFALAGMLYRFQAEDTQRLRWIALGLLATLVIGQAFFDSGETERKVLVYASPWLVVFGAGFFGVLVRSHDFWLGRARLAATLVLVLQALPLAHDLLEPRRIHFQYPPYFPGLFYTLGYQMSRQSFPAPWMADVPAGAAWYSGQRVWDQPATLTDFYRISSEVPIRALALTSHTFEKPILAELAALRSPSAPTATWPHVYAALHSLQFPGAFPLKQTQRVDHKLWVLLSPDIRSYSQP